MSTIRELQDRAYQQSADKGFHDDEPTEPRAVLSLNAERIALMHSELSEALEELRKGWNPAESYYVDGDDEVWSEQRYTGALAVPVCKPEGVPSELADVVIRVLDFCGANGIDLETAITAKLDYNASRSRMHGGKAF